MAKTTTEKAADKKPAAATNVVALPRLVYPTEAKDFGIDLSGWRTLVEAIYPAAQTQAAVMMVLDYCKRRNLDPFKRVCHIVPVWDAKLKRSVETVWPGIAEIRTTAMRTGNYAGMDVPAYGPTVTTKFTGQIFERNEQGGGAWKTIEAEVTYPEWCQVTLYRKLGADRLAYPGPRVMWTETYAAIRANCPVPNHMWQKRPVGQLEKCAEAAALRRAFPEELGNEYAAEEMEGMTRTHEARDVTPEVSVSVGESTEREPEPEDFDADLGRGQSASGTAGTTGGAEGASSGSPATDTEWPDEREEPEPEPEPLVFEIYKTARAFFDFSDEWLADPKRTADEARQWEVFYRAKLAEFAKHEYKRVQEAAAHTISLYSAVLAREPR